MLSNKWNDIKPDGLCIIDTLGKFNIVRFMNLLKYFKIEHWVLFDKDEDKKNN